MKTLLTLIILTAITSCATEPQESLEISSTYITRGDSSAIDTISLDSCITKKCCETKTK